MPEIVDKIKSLAENKLNQKSQPGDKVEASADNSVNQSESARSHGPSSHMIKMYQCYAACLVLDTGPVALVSNR